MKKLIILLLSLVLVLGLAACADDSGSGPAAGTDEYRVALLLPGPITDRGWSASGHAGLMAVENELGLEVNFRESVAAADMESDFRFFASQGYNILIGMGSQFTDAMLAVAEEFPDAYFVLVNGSVYTDNVRSVQLSDEHAGFLAGATAALLTESGIVGMVAGQDVPPILRGLNGFEQGVNEVNSRTGRNVQYMTSFTGSMEDVGMAREFALAMVDQGADILYELANQAGLGVVEAAVERDIFVIGSSTDQNAAAPEHVVQSMVRDTPQAYVTFVQQILDGNFTPEVIMYGIGEGVIHLAPWHGHDEWIDPEVIEQLQAIIDDVRDGVIVVTGYMR
jgi:basic membrane protein A